MEDDAIKDFRLESQIFTVNQEASRNLARSRAQWSRLAEICILQHSLHQVKNDRPWLTNFTFKTGIGWRDLHFLPSGNYRLSAEVLTPRLHKQIWSSPMTNMFLAFPIISIIVWTRAKISCTSTKSFDDQSPIHAGRGCPSRRYQWRKWMRRVSESHRAWSWHEGELLWYWTYYKVIQAGSVV